MRVPQLSKRWLWITAAISGVVIGLALGTVAVYRSVGATMIESRLETLGNRLDRKIAVGSVKVSFGRAVLRDFSLRGSRDGDTPLVHVDSLEVAFNVWSSLIGRVELGEAMVDGVVVNLRRDADGRDNIQDAIAHWRSAASAGTLGRRHARPSKVTVSHLRLIANDDETGATGLVADGEATWTEGELIATGRGITATTVAAPRVRVASARLDYRSGEPPAITIEGGEFSLLPQLALSGISGRITTSGERPGRFALDVAGGYGGVPGKLWTAKGEMDTTAATARIDLEAAKFQLDRLAPILAHSAVVDYQATSIDTKLHVDIDRAGAKFRGEFHLHGLNVGHPYIASKQVHGLDLSGDLAGSFDRKARRLELTQGDFIARDVPFSLTGFAAAPPFVESALPPPKDPNGSERFPPIRGPHGIQQISVHLVIPPVDCQRMLQAFPPEMVPYMQGYRLQGLFNVDIHTDIDWNDLDALSLGGIVGIDRCRVVDQPADSPARLKTEFEHYIETEKGEWQSFVVGPANPDFVPLAQISPYLRKSIQSSEDFGFYRHHGFIPSEFRTALVNNLKRQKFAQGASSITMQMVKNVLLFREKTLARKLQELFLTWQVEHTLDKDRIFEIYLNVIEFGPGLFGIGPAAHYYFGKSAQELDPVEAAFFSSILPDPKGRSAQFCSNALTKWTTTKITHILQNLFKRNLLTQDEYDRATVTPLVFYKTSDSESEEDCLRRVKRAIKNARSTNPLAEQPKVERNGAHGPPSIKVR